MCFLNKIYIIIADWTQNNPQSSLKFVHLSREKIILTPHPPSVRFREKSGDPPSPFFLIAQNLNAPQVKLKKKMEHVPNKAWGQGQN